MSLQKHIAFIEKYYGFNIFNVKASFDILYCYKLMEVATILQGEYLKLAMCFLL